MVQDQHAVRVDLVLLNRVLFYFDGASKLDLLSTAQAHSGAASKPTPDTYQLSPCEAGE